MAACRTPSLASVARIAGAHVSCSCRARLLPPHALVAAANAAAASRPALTCLLHSSHAGSSSKALFSSAGSSNGSGGAARRQQQRQSRQQVRHPPCLPMHFALDAPKMHAHVVRPTHPRPAASGVGAGARPRCPRCPRRRRPRGRQQDPAQPVLALLCRAVLPGALDRQHVAGAGNVLPLPQPAAHQLCARSAVHRGREGEPRGCLPACLHPQAPPRGSL